eukprot:4752641-Prymnesium_polylepis.2
MHTAGRHANSHDGERARVETLAWVVGGRVTSHVQTTALRVPSHVSGTCTRVVGGTGAPSATSTASHSSLSGV